MDGAATMAEIRHTFRTPLRILVPKLLKSRDDWKTKSHERKVKLKAAQIKIRDLSASREMWKERFEEAEAKNRELQKELEHERQALQAALTQLEDLKKKIADPPKSVDAPPPRGGQHSTSIISLALDLVLKAGCSLRGTAAVLAIVVEHGFASFAVPCFSTIRSWLLRVGHYALARSLDATVPWLWLIDHTVQIGALKMLAILGCPLSVVPFGQRALQLSDLQLIALVPMEKSNGAAVQTELETAAKRTGAPRLIVSDQGSDLRKGVADFQSTHPETAYVPDAAHYGANVLEHAWEDQPRWQQFTKELQDAASKLRQTKSAYLLPPRMRAKARFMNVQSQLQFARRVLKHLDSADPHAKAAEHYGWLRDFRDDLAIWVREHSLVQTMIELVRVEGLHADTESLLKKKWGPMNVRASTIRIADQLQEYVRQYRPSVTAERFVASTEILESSFGKLKRLEGDQSQNGMTGLVLATGAIVGTCTESEIKEALDATPEKKVDNWVSRTLGPTVQWLRKKFFGENKV